MKAVILCGGLATRMLPITKNIPKEMMAVLNKPIIQYLIEDLIENGINEILIVTTRGKECIENYFDYNFEIEDRLNKTNKTQLLSQLNNLINKVNIHFIRQNKSLGTGHAILKGKSFVGNEDFIFLFGDELLFNPNNSLVKQLLSKFNENKNSVISIKECDLNDSEKYGMIKFENNKFFGIVEKPKPKDSPSNFCFLGNSIFNAKIFDYIKTEDESKIEIGIVDAINDYAKEHSVDTKVVEGERFDVGNKLGLVKANLFFGLQDEEIKQELKDYILSLKI